MIKWVSSILNWNEIWENYSHKNGLIYFLQFKMSKINLGRKRRFYALLRAKVVIF